MASNDREKWGSDVPVSAPHPPPADVPVHVDFGGFGFSTNGMVHNITQPDLEDMLTPFYSPEGQIDASSIRDFT